MVRRICVVLFCGIFLPNVFLAQTPTGYEVKKVVIDPGHGGKDPGALGTGKYRDTESDIALSISLKVREYIQQQYDNVQVIMTRDKDNFVELRHRTKIANDANADLFISIHCNTNANKEAIGAETYVIGMHKTESNLEVAKRENQVIFLEDNYEVNYLGFDPNSPESMVGLSMMQSQYLDQSILFADLVQQQFTNRVGRKDRGVKQAGYWVISYTMMPSVLIELGFISNSVEENFLNSEEGRVYMASAIFRAFKEYKTEMEGVDVTQSKGTKTHNVIATPVDTNSQKVVGETSNQSQKAVDPKLEYRIQVAFSNRNLELKPYNFKGHNDISMIKKGNNYLYFLGHFPHFDDALAFQRELRKSDYQDAFIVAFYDGKQISLKEAEQISSNN